MQRGTIVWIGLLAVLVGVIILSISNSDFFGTGGFSGWSRGIPILAIWSAFWALLWLSTRDRQPAFGRMPYRMAVALAFSAALLVLTFDALGGRWRWESRAYAEALSLCPSLPPLVEEIRGTTTSETPPPSPVGRPEDARTRTLPRSPDGPARPSYRVASVARKCPRNADGLFHRNVRSSETGRVLTTNPSRPKARIGLCLVPIPDRRFNKSRCRIP